MSERGGEGGCYKRLLCKLLLRSKPDDEERPTLSGSKASQQRNNEVKPPRGAETLVQNASNRNFPCHMTPDS